MVQAYGTCVHKYKKWESNWFERICFPCGLTMMWSSNQQKKHRISAAIIIMYYYDEVACDSELTKLSWYWKKVFVCLIRRRICGFQIQNICSNPEAHLLYSASSKTKSNWPIILNIIGFLISIVHTTNVSAYERKPCGLSIKIVGPILTVSDRNQSCTDLISGKV